MKLIQSILVLSIIAVVYFTPAQAAGESNLHYILAGKDSWQSTASVAVMAVCIIILVFNHLVDG